jgi:hypothetical protein
MKPGSCAIFVIGDGTAGYLVAIALAWTTIRDR